MRDMTSADLTELTTKNSGTSEAVHQVRRTVSHTCKNQDKPVYDKNKKKDM